MKITHDKVYDLAESIVASGLPMKAEYDEVEFVNDKEELYKDYQYELHKSYRENSDVKRALKLASNPSGSGHCNFLSGILVSLNVTATNVWWLQMERYHFVQIVSMQSKMHRLRSMAIRKDIAYKFNNKTNKAMIADWTGNNEKLDEEELVYSCPMGLELTARITTNYLQLKTIYNQRKNHKLQEWRDFCAWIESLPMSELITGDGLKNQ